MDIPNWIQKLASVRESMRMLDTEQLYRYYPPNEGCSAEDLLQAEQHLGRKLDRQYAEFLRHADGWREFFTSITLFGTRELLSGAEMDTARELLDIVYPFNEHLEFQKEELLPIAVDEAGRCFFVLAPPTEEKQAAVIWFVGQEVERYASFYDFLEAILQYNIDDLEESFQGSPAEH